MKMKRRIALLLTAACLLCCLGISAAAAENTLRNFRRSARYRDDTFSDVVSGAWYEASVSAAYELGLMKGDAGGTFRPGDSLTLAETATLAARLHSVFHTGKDSFAAGTPWYQPYVDYALQNGILSAAREDYTRSATRREFAAMLAHALPESVLPVYNPEITDDCLPDLKCSEEGGPEIYLLYRAGVLCGNDEYGTFAPETEIRRSDVAAIITRMASRSLRVRVHLAQCPDAPAVTPEPTPVVTPEPAPGVTGVDLPERPRADDAFFADAAMLGNSLVDGMMLYSGLPMSYFGGTGLTVFQNRLGELLQQTYGKVYVELGINEIGGAQDSFLKSYRSLIDQIHTALPEAEIYLMAITPVTKAVNDKGTFTMSRIGSWNAALHDLAEETGCRYLDCCTALCDETGYLPERYAGWDGSPHLEVAGYKAWAEAIRTHYAE